MHRCSGAVYISLALLNTFNYELRITHSELLTFTIILKNKNIIFIFKDFCGKV